MPFHKPPQTAPPWTHTWRQRWGGYTSIIGGVVNGAAEADATLAPLVSAGSLILGKGYNGNWTTLRTNGYGGPRPNYYLLGEVDLGVSAPGAAADTTYTPQDNFGLMLASNGRVRADPQSLVEADFVHVGGSAAANRIAGLNGTHDYYPINVASANVLARAGALGQWLTELAAATNCNGLFLDNMDALNTYGFGRYGIGGSGAGYGGYGTTQSTVEWGANGHKVSSASLGTAGVPYRTAYLTFLQTIANAVKAHNSSWYFLANLINPQGNGDDGTHTPWDADYLFASGLLDGCMVEQPFGMLNGSYTQPTVAALLAELNFYARLRDAGKIVILPSLAYADEFPEGAGAAAYGYDNARELYHRACFALIAGPGVYWKYNYKAASSYSRLYTNQPDANWSLGVPSGSHFQKDVNTLRRNFANGYVEVAPGTALPQPNNSVAISGYAGATIHYGA